MTTVGDDSSVNTHYTFGDVDLAGDRLAILAQVFESSMFDFLNRNRDADAERRVDASLRVLDLGCGPGWTTRTLARVLSPKAIVGVDGSERFIAKARAESPPNIEYLCGDVTTIDMSPLSVDLVFSRFLLTHLPDPASALSHWASAVQPGGRVLLQETAALASTDPALGRYYGLVGELQRRHGQSLHIGRDLPALVDPSLFRVVSFVETPVAVSASAMARLHAMNIQTWQHDEAARDFDQAEVQRLTLDLTTLAADPRSQAGVAYRMGEMVLERR